MTSSHPEQAEESALDKRLNSIEERLAKLERGHVRQGIGTMLLAAVEATAQTLGITRLSLDSSLNAVEFYASAGYSAVAEATHELEPGVHIPCVTMQKALRANAGA